LTSGLHFLQQKNLIHRDIKPANILLSENSENAIIKLADFGFAKHLAGETFRLTPSLPLIQLSISPAHSHLFTEAALAQTPCGSPLYMAPEIFEMQEYDAKADLWSVGCVYYEMLVGRPPFRGANPRELFQNIRTKPLAVPPEIQIGHESLTILRKVRNLYTGASS
jgi:serine/threonine-protein kinase ULK/ATG1